MTTSVTAGELWPDARWCKGCGFPNDSTGPCAVCGTDPETGEVDQGFIDQQMIEHHNEWASGRFTHEDEDDDA